MTDIFERLAAEKDNADAYRAIHDHTEAEVQERAETSQERTVEASKKAAEAIGRNAVIV